jgi:hypothetical protein
MKEKTIPLMVLDCFRPILGLIFSPESSATIAKRDEPFLRFPVFGDKLVLTVGNPRQSNATLRAESSFDFVNTWVT